MTSERPGFPIGLTLAVVVVFAVCCALGGWQLQRAAWKQQELKRIEALQTAAPVAIGPTLQRLSTGADVSFTRVVVDCAAAKPAPAILKPTPDNGDWVARAVSPCALAGALAGPYDGVMVDRGLVAATRGQPEPPPMMLPAPVHVIGVLFPRTGFPPSSLQRPAPVVLVAESETPAPMGLVPTPYPGGGADQLQYVGAYWLTWFGLAGALAAIYAAVLWRRYHPKQ